MAQDWLETSEGGAAIGLSDTGAPVAPIILGHPILQPTPVGRREPEIIWIGNEVPAAQSAVRQATDGEVGAPPGSGHLD